MLFAKRLPYKSGNSFNAACTYFGNLFKLIILVKEYNLQRIVFYPFYILFQRNIVTRCWSNIRLVPNILVVNKSRQIETLLCGARKDKGFVTKAVKTLPYITI